VNSPGVAAEFIASTRGRLFVLTRHPPSFSGRCVLVVPAFAEEMNKSRKMVTELSKRLVALGWGVIVVDPYGTGDSDGEFSAADCDTWHSDLLYVDRWASSKSWTIDALLGIRLGCIFAARFGSECGRKIARTVFWQPVLDGARALDQLLRTRVAASLMNDQKESAAELKNRLAVGGVVEVAGYDLSPALAAQLQKLKLTDWSGAALGRVDWFEILRTRELAVSAAGLKVIEGWSGAGAAVTLHSLVGEPFWTSTEIVCVPELLDETAGLFQGIAT
jgi:exosortase A-associated hydrolase 2